MTTDNVVELLQDAWDDIDAELPSYWVDEYSDWLYTYDGDDPSWEHFEKKHQERITESIQDYWWEELAKYARSIGLDPSDSAVHEAITTQIWASDYEVPEAIREIEAAQYEDEDQAIFSEPFNFLRA